MAKALLTGRTTDQVRHQKVVTSLQIKLQSTVSFAHPMKDKSGERFKHQEQIIITEGKIYKA